ncbi:MAG: hypothetical protein KDN18_11140 [Verrucomicrobiae bacterium]|nr:hypothetical protein [Verrucomicrobiae bacterium]
MSEKASRNEGADKEAEVPGEVQGLPLGEEIALGPVEGEEIDPLPKWWDEPIAAEKSRTGNRRLEDGIEFESPRRRKPLPSIDEEALALPFVSEETREKPDSISIPDPDREAEVKPARSLSEIDDPDPEAKAILPAELPEEESTLVPASSDLPSPEGGKSTKGNLADLLDDGAAPGGVGDSTEPTPGTEIEPPTKKEGGPEKEKRVLPPLETIDGDAGGTPEKSASKSPPPLPLAKVKPLKVSLPVPIEKKSVANGAAPESDPFTSEEAEKEKVVPGDSEVGKVIVSELPESPPVDKKSASAPAKDISDGDGAESAEKEPPASDLEKIEAPEPILEVVEANDEAKDIPAEKVNSGESANSEDPDAEILEGTPEAAAKKPPVEDKVGVAASEAAPKRKAGCWTVFATLFFIVTMLVIGLLAAGGYFAWSKMGEFEDEVVALVGTKLASQGVYFESGSWSYEFPRGLVFDEVTLYDDETKSRPVLKAASLGVNLDVPALVTNPGEMETVEISLEDSKLDLFQKGELFAEIEGVDAEVFVGPAKLTVERFSALIGGLKVNLVGEVAFPDKAPNPVGDEGASAREEGGSKPSSLASLDFSAFASLQPWTTFESGGDGAPELSLRVFMNSAEPDLARIEGDLSGERVKWKGVEFASVFASFHINPGTGELRFPRIQVGYGEGLISAVLAIDTGSGKLRIEKLLSTADVSSLLPAFDPSWAETFRKIRFADAPTLQVVGEIPFSEPGNADLKIRCEHRLGFAYLDGDRELPVSDIRGLFTYDRGALETNDTAARLFGGQVYVNGAMNFVREKRPFTGLIEISDLSLENAATWFGQEGTGLSGRLTLSFRGTGNEEMSSISGGGNLRIDDANLPEFPAIGKVQGMIGSVLPAFAPKSGMSLGGAYILESGVLVTNDLTVSGGGVRLVTNGSVNLEEKTTKFVATADLEPALAAASGLKDVSIRVEGDGPLEEPVLKLRQFPVEFAGGTLSGVLGSTPESLAKLKTWVGPEDVEVFTGPLEDAAGLGLDPDLVEWLKGLRGGEAPEASAPAAPVLRAVPEN